MNASELRELSEGDLRQRLAEAKDELFKLRFRNVTSQLDNHSRLGEVRRDIARILTVMTERERDGKGEAPQVRNQTRRQRLAARAKGRS